MAKILVTGGCGFIGSHLVDRLLNRGDDVIVLDDLSSGYRSNVPKNIPVVVGSVTEHGLVADLMKNIDCCFHLAAIASVDRSREDWLGTNDVNLRGTISVFNAARNVGGNAIPVVYASSAAVYGIPSSLPLKENSDTRPLSGYGADKLACELHAMVAGRMHKIPTIGFRFFNVYGPRQNPYSPYSGVISIFVDRIRRGAPVVIYGDGEQVRDFVYVSDVVDCLISGEKYASVNAGIYNVCSGIPTSVNRLARTLGDLCGIPIYISHRPPRLGDIQNSLGDPEKLTIDLGVRCNTHISEGLKLTLNWSRDEEKANISQSLSR